MKIKFYLKPTCRKARSFLLDQGAELDFVDLRKGLSVEELDRLEKMIAEAKKRARKAPKKGGKR